MERINKRNPEISALNVFLCLLVIFIHVSSAPVTWYEKDSLQFAVVFAMWRSANFAVQGFIFLAGVRFFLSKRDIIDYRRFYIGRFVKIIIPYIVWNVIFYLWFLSKGNILFPIQEFPLHIIRGDLVSPFYFVVVIVQFYALAPLWRLIIKKSNMLATLIISAVITLILGQYLPRLLTLVFPEFSFKLNDRVLTTYLIYWIGGCYVGKYYDKAKAWVKKIRNPIIILFVLLLLTEVILSYISFSGIFYLRWLEYIHFLYCICAVLFFFMLFSLIYENRSIKNRLIIAVDRTTYLIFLMHCLVIFMINDVMVNMQITSITLAYIIRIITVYPIAIIGCILWDKFKTRLFSLIGK